MKIIFIHIPKTAGSTISSVLHTPGITGRWLMEKDLWPQDPEKLWQSDILAGHFSIRHISLYAQKHGLELDSVKFITVVRDPWQQLFSNLNFPYELQRRGEPVTQEWMQDLITEPPCNEENLFRIMKKYSWLTDMQTQYLLTPKKTLDPSRFDMIGVFPNIEHVTDHIYKTIGVEKPEEKHLNKSEKLIPKSFTTSKENIQRITPLLTNDLHTFNLFKEYSENHFPLESP